MPESCSRYGLCERSRKRNGPKIFKVTRVARVRGTLDPDTRQRALHRLTLYLPSIPPRLPGFSASKSSLVWALASLVATAASKAALVANRTEYERECDKTCSYSADNSSPHCPSGRFLRSFYVAPIQIKSAIFSCIGLLIGCCSITCGYMLAYYRWVRALAAISLALVAWGFVLWLALYA
ncbi:hypothetical protein MMA231_00061 [Asticcacaulis sp. MM231]